MPILYALIRHSSTVLCEVTAEGVEGDFSALTRLLLRRLPARPPSPAPSSSSAEPSLHSAYQAYLYDQLVFHYVHQHDLIALCVTDRAFPREVAFAFLAQLHSSVLSSPALPHPQTQQQQQQQQEAPSSPSSASLLSASLLSASSSTSAPPPPPSFHALYQPSLSSLISHFNALSLPPPPDTVVAQSMVHSIDRVVQRGQPIEVLVQKVETMEARGIRFDRLPGAARDGAGGRRARKGHVERNARIAAVLCVFVGAIGYVGLTLGCGGVGLQKCF